MARGEEICSAVIASTRKLLGRIAILLGFSTPAGPGAGRGADVSRQRTRRSYTVSVALHLAVLLLSLVSIRGCRHRVPAGVPMGKGDKLTMGKVTVIRTPERVYRKKRVRESPVSVYQMVQEQEEDIEQRTAQQFADSVGVPGGVGEGAAAAGSPRGTALGGKLYFYRVKFNGPNWKANSGGVRPLMQEVLRAGVVKKVSGFNNVVTLKELPRHSGEYFPALLYMTGTGHIKASDEEVSNLRAYLLGGGMLFADVSGGDFHRHFEAFMRRVLPDRKLTVIEFDNEIYRGRRMPYAMVRGCPLYRKHRGSGPALGIWTGPRISVFYSRGDLGSAWASVGLFRRRRPNVEQAFRMGVNIIAYSLLYYRHIEEES
jgi:hypothetical protein